MRKLLSTGFSRLWKDKTFWTVEIAILLWGCFAYVLAIYNAGNLGQAWVIQKANSYFYHPLLYTPAAMAIFCAQFWGTEYEQGTLRNKITVGHSRESIYLSSLMVTVVVGMIFTVSHLLTSMIAVPFLGVEIITAVNHDVWRYVCWLLIIVVYAALFVMLAMMDHNKARNVLISILLALVLVFAGIYVYGKMTEPEYISRLVMDETGQYVLDENSLNTRYLRGSLRTVFDWWCTIMPSSQGIYIMSSDSECDMRMPVASVSLIVALTLFGITYFKRKDIK